MNLTSAFENVTSDVCGSNRALRKTQAGLTVNTWTELRVKAFDKEVVFGGQNVSKFITDGY